MRFAHIADTHIRNLKYHHEYNEVFKQLYESLRTTGRPLLIQVLWSGFYSCVEEIFLALGITSI